MSPEGTKALRSTPFQSSPSRIRTLLERDDGGCKIKGSHRSSSEKRLCSPLRSPFRESRPTDQPAAMLSVPLFSAQYLPVEKTPACENQPGTNLEIVERSAVHKTQPLPERLPPKIESR